MNNEKQYKKRNRRIVFGACTCLLVSAIGLYSYTALSTDNVVSVKAVDNPETYFWYSVNTLPNSFTYLMDYDGDAYNREKASVLYYDLNGYAHQYDRVDSLIYDKSESRYQINYYNSDNQFSNAYAGVSNVKDIYCRFDSNIYGYYTAGMSNTGINIERKTFSFNNYFSLTGYYDINSPAIVNNSTLSGKNCIYRGLFRSNNETFNEIEVVWASAVGMKYVDLDNTTRVNTTSGYYAPVYMSYNNTQTGVKKTVGSPVYRSSDSGNVLTRQFKFDDTRYTNIELISRLTSNSYNHTRYPNSNWVDVITMRINDTTIPVGTGDALSDTFSLIGTTFTALIPLLNLQIGSNITLGVLLLIPLLGIIIFAIVKLLKS